MQNITEAIQTKPGQTIPEILGKHDSSQPDAIAIMAPGRVPVSYRALYSQVGTIVRTLNSMGIGRNDRVAIVLPNGPEMAISFLAVASASTSAPLNPAYQANDFEFYLSDLSARALLTLRDFNTPAVAVAQRLGIPIIQLAPRAEPDSGLFDLEGMEAPPAPVCGFAEPGDIALILHTSGTTSRPKMVPLNHINICTSAKNINNTLQLTASDRCLNVMPLFHIHGLIGALLSSIHAGASIICTPGFQIDRFFEWFEQHQPSWYSAVPTIHQAILNRAETNKRIIAANPLRLIRSSSASLPPHVMEELEKVFHTPVIESYGMTEASHQMTSNPLPPLQRKPGTVGLPAGPEVAIMDAQGHLLSQGDTGEIVIRGSNVTQGYENNPEANMVAFTDGWFRTGDEGYFDNDGYLYISGRIKEIINRGGEKIVPREIDEALLRHDAVAQAVAFATPHPTLGEDVGAAVVLKKGTSIGEKELRDFAFTELAAFKVPSRIIFMDDIPKGPTGKLQRIGLAGRLEEQLRPPYVAPQNETHQILTTLMAEVLKIERIGILDNFFTLGGDSLLAALYFAKIEQNLGKKLPLATLFQAPTVQQLTEILEDKTWSAPWASLVNIQPEGSRPPLYFVHAHEGNVVGYYPLSQNLGLDQPFYGLQAQGLDEDEARQQRIEDMAAHYISEIRSGQPNGPYYLGGWCMGGVIAYEIAQQLQEQGENVALLAMIQSTHPNYPKYKSNTTPIHRFLFRAFQRLDLEYSRIKEISSFKGKAGRVLGRLTAIFTLMFIFCEKLLTWPAEKAGLHLPHTRAYELKSLEGFRTMAYAQYCPQPYEGDAVIISAEKQPLGIEPDPTLGWGNLIRGELELEQIPGYRIGLLSEPRVRTLATILRKHIDRGIEKYHA